VTRLLEPGRDRQLRSRLAGPVDASRLPAWVARLGEGNRNCGLFWAACRVIEAGQACLLDDLAEAAVTTGLPDREIARTIASARRRAEPAGARQPRREQA